MKLIFITLCILTAPRVLASSPVRSTPSPAPIVIGPMPTVAPPVLVSRIALQCDSSCSAEEKADLPSIVQVLLKTEASQCFQGFLLGQTDILEAKTKTNVQIVQDLTTRSLSATLVIWYPTWSEYVFHGAAKACGFENGDGNIHAKEACYKLLNTCGKASLFAHELSHILGYTHNTAGNQKAGNEQTVPYLVNAAFDKCCS